VRDVAHIYTLILLLAMAVLFDLFPCCAGAVLRAEKPAEVVVIADGGAEAAAAALVARLCGVPRIRVVDMIGGDASTRVVDVVGGDASTRVVDMVGGDASVEEQERGGQRSDAAFGVDDVLDMAGTAAGPVQQAATETARVRTHHDDSTNGGEVAAGDGVLLAAICL